MFEQHDRLECPPDDAVIWRYMSFTKLVSLLDRKALWFSRVDLLEDPWEGAYTKPYVDQHFPSGLSSSEKAISHAQLRQRLELRKTFAVNCWHLGPGESAAMWKLYGGEKECVAVRSTVGRFKKALRDASEQAVL